MQPTDKKTAVNLDLTPDEFKWLALVWNQAFQAGTPCLMGGGGIKLAGEDADWKSLGDKLRDANPFAQDGDTRA